MFIVAYDISNNKTRTRFSNFLKKYGRRIQYSVFEIKNSNRVLNNILLEIENRYKAKFTDADSILIFPLGKTTKVYRFGYAVNEEKKIVFL